MPTTLTVLVGPPDERGQICDICLASCRCRSGADRGHSESSTDQAITRCRLRFPSTFAPLCKKYATPQPMDIYQEPVCRINVQHLVSWAKQSTLYCFNQLLLSSLHYLFLFPKVCFVFVSFLFLFLMLGGLGGLKFMLRDLVLRV